MAESWVRLWAGSTTDPKWQTIARKSGQPRYLVIALFTHLLMVANDAETRGDIDQLSIEDTASALDCDEEQVEAIVAAMQGRVIDDGRLTGWEKRQPVREDVGDEKTGAMSAAERKRLQREREKERDVTACHDESRGVTARHAPEAEADTEADINPKPQAAAFTQPAPGEEPGNAAAMADPIVGRAIEITALLTKRGAALQASDPRVRAWATRGVTDTQAMQAMDIANERRQEWADHRPINAGLLDAILPDITDRPAANARASPIGGRRQTVSDDRKAASMILTGRNPKNERPTANPERDITADCQRIA